MHVAFMVNGKYEEVERLFRDMRAQKHMVPLFDKDGKEVKRIWIEGQLRILPFGVYEYVFPKEDLARVLHTINADKNGYKIPNVILATIRKVLRLKPIPKYKTEESYLWMREYTGFVPLGIREDKEILDPNLNLYHEAI